MRRLVLHNQLHTVTQKKSRRIVVAAQNITFRYQDEAENDVIKNVTFNVYHNELICIIGSNGSGKSTLSKIIGGILRPQKGKVYIDNILISHDNLTKIRQKIGIVFQNPENQFIGTTVYDDIAFGLQNYNVPTNKQPEIIRSVAKRLKISHLLNKEPHELSGGQKQKVAVASVFVLKPEIIIFDESTSMIDEDGKKQITELMHLLKNKYQKTIISVTHCMDDTINADRVLVIHQGENKFFLPPKKLFLNHDKELTKLRLDIPNALKISTAVTKIDRTIVMKDCIHQFNKLYQLQNPDNHKQFLLSCQQLKKFHICEGKGEIQLSPLQKKTQKTVPIIEVKNYSITYNKKTISRVRALQNMTCSFAANKINIIVGKAGVGKSTLFQVIDFLIRGEKGTVSLNFGANEKFLLSRKRKPVLNQKKCQTNLLRRRIGLVFQFPEYQLFNITVLKEVLFSFFNFNRSKNSNSMKFLFFWFCNLLRFKRSKKKSKYSLEIIKKAEGLLKLVQINKKYLYHNPLELSGGQKRKVAIASVISYSPVIVMFDEPTAGLDPASAKNILNLVKDLKTKQQKTILLITHDMDLALEVGDNLTIFEKGSALASGKCYDMFRNQDLISKEKIILPRIIQIMQKMNLAVILEKQRLNIKTFNQLSRYLRIVAK